MHRSVFLRLPGYVGCAKNKSLWEGVEDWELINPQTHILALSVNPAFVYILIKINSCNLLHNTQQVKTYIVAKPDPCTHVCLCLHISFLLLNHHPPFKIKKIQNPETQCFFLCQFALWLVYQLFVICELELLVLCIITCHLCNGFEQRYMLSTPPHVLKDLWNLAGSYTDTQTQIVHRLLCHSCAHTQTLTHSVFPHVVSQCRVTGD